MEYNNGVGTKDLFKGFRLRSQSRKVPAFVKTPKGVPDIARGALQRSGTRRRK